MKLRRVAAVTAARNREFLRDRASLSWNLAFPLLLVVGCAVVFSRGGLERYQVGLYGQAGEHSPIKAFLALKHVRFEPVARLGPAIHEVARQKLDLLVDLDNRRYWVNRSSPRGYILERVLKGSGGAAFQRQPVTGRAVRYVDWVLPGILGMNMMFSALYGVGYVLVRYRKNGVLRRLKATPLEPLEFLLAQVLSRLLLNLFSLILVLLVASWLIDFRMQGSYLTLLAVFVVGALSLISLGLLVATRTASEELAEGLLNVLSWPMLFLSGVWFSLASAPAWVREVAQFLPLTHVVASARAVMVDGAGLRDVAGSLVVLVAMTVVFLVLGAYLFRWE